LRPGLRRTTTRFDGSIRKCGGPARIGFRLVESTRKKNDSVVTGAKNAGQKPKGLVKGLVKGLAPHGRRLVYTFRVRHLNCRPHRRSFTLAVRVGTGSRSPDSGLGRKEN